MLSHVAEIVRKHDPDRFLTALFAPAGRREALFTLYAFNHELARAREMVREPMMALIRLQWWREVIEGARRRHEVAGPLGEALDRGELLPADLERMIAGREMEAEGLSDPAAWRSFVLATAGGVTLAAASALVRSSDDPHPDPLPGEEAAAVLALGAAYGAAGILRSEQALAVQGRRLLPEGGAEAVRKQGLAWLEAGRVRLPKAVRPAVLVAALARRDLRRGASPGPRGLGDRLAVTRAGLLNA